MLSISHTVDYVGWARESKWEKEPYTEQLRTNTGFWKEKEKAASYISIVRRKSWTASMQIIQYVSVLS